MNTDREAWKAENFHNHYAQSGKFEKHEPFDREKFFGTEPDYAKLEKYSLLSWRKIEFHEQSGNPFPWEICAVVVDKLRGTLCYPRGRIRRKAEGEPLEGEIAYQNLHGQIVRNPINLGRKPSVPEALHLLESALMKQLAVLHKASGQLYPMDGELLLQENDEGRYPAEPEGEER